MLRCPLLVVLLQAAQPSGQRAPPEPHGSPGKPDRWRAGAPAAPPVEGGPGDPQAGDHLIDGQQVIGIAGHAWSLLPRRCPRGRGRCVSVPAACPCGVVHARSGLARWSSPRGGDATARAGQRAAGPCAAPARRGVRTHGPAREGQWRGLPGPSGGRCGPHGAASRGAAGGRARWMARGFPAVAARLGLTSRAEWGVDRRRCMTGLAAASRGPPTPGRCQQPISNPGGA